MPRLRNVRTGAVVSCSEATAARLGSEWTVDDEPVAKASGKKPAKADKK